jgi:hypothetical protein
MTYKGMLRIGMLLLIAALLSLHYLPESMDGLKGLLMGLSIGCNLVSARLKCVERRLSSEA